MKEILSYIRQRAEGAREHPFIVWLHDETVPVEDRLTRWLPNSAAMTMGFKDLNELIFVYPEAEAETDARKRAINEHARENLEDWKPYLHDLEVLGLDRNLPFTQIVRFIWRSETDAARRFFYRLCELTKQAEDPALRLCLVLPFADFKRILFDQLAALAGPYMKESGASLEYVSRRVHHRDIRPVFEATLLHEASRKQAQALAEYTCNEIEERWMGNLKFMQKTPLPWDGDSGMKGR